MYEHLPKLFNEAELHKDWSAVLQVLQTLSETGEKKPLPDWLAVEIIWMKIQFERQRLEIDRSELDVLEQFVEALENASYWQQIIDFNGHFLLLDQQYMHDQGVAEEIGSLSQFLAHPKSKQISPHPLFNINRYIITAEKLNQNPHQHPLVHFFRHSSGYCKSSPLANLYFDTDWYRENYLHSQPFKDPLLHYLAHFHEAQPSRHFYNEYVRQTQKLPMAIDPLTYYLKQLQNQGVDFCLDGFSPCPYFDRSFYLANYKDIKDATENGVCEPFLHFSLYGIKGRRGHPWLEHDMATEAMIAKFPTNKRLAVIVLGMHRSGTSALTKAISLLGMDFPTHLIKEDVANPTGYWESYKLAEIHDDMLPSLDSSWDDILPIDENKFQIEEMIRYKSLLTNYIVKEFSDSERFILKDPRMCRLMPIWLDVLDSLNVEVKVVLPFRHPLEVAKSLQQRDGFLLEKSFLLWLTHVLAAERHTRGLKRCWVNYSELLSDPQKVINIIAALCEMDVNKNPDAEAQIKQYIDVQYYRQRLTEVDLREANLSGWILQVYNILKEWSDNMADEPIFRDKFDSIAESMR